jgi:hypothetical protein
LLWVEGWRSAIRNSASQEKTVVSTVGEVVRDLLIFIGALTVLLLGLILVIAKMRDDHPLKRLLKALGYRFGATVLAGAVAIPIEPIPGLDVIYDIGAPLLLLLYWISFFKNAGAMMSPPTVSQPPAPSRRSRIAS